MTAPYRKKLIEVALPLKAINEASAREKSIRHGHPSTLHLWWARRPLAACRAVLFASLVDDPDSDPAYRKADGTVDEDRAGLKRAQLFNLIEELVQWENSNNPRVINAARAEIARCVASRKIELGELQKDTVVFGMKKGEAHPKGAVSGDGTTAWEVLLMQARPEVVNAFLVEHAPPVLDPFAGGGSIPLEAQRLGLRAFASDLNPVAVLINKALIEIPPKFAGRPPVNPEWQGKSEQEKALARWERARGLAEDVRYYGKWMRDEAEKRIGHLYPKVKITAEVAADRPDLKEYVGQELTVIAWLWARTVASPNPACRGAHIPLVTSFALSSGIKKAWVEPIVDRSSMSYQFEVRTQEGPVPLGTINRTRGDRCLLSDEPIAREHIRSEGRAGRLRIRLMAIVAQGRKERIYLSPIEGHELLAKGLRIPDDVPDTEITGDTRYLTPTTYGMTKYFQLFTSRQLTLLGILGGLVDESRRMVLKDSNGDQAYAKAVATYLGLCSSKSAVFNTTLARWRAGEGKSAPAFGRQALAMVWDFTEVNPFAGAGGDFGGVVDGAYKTVLSLPAAPSGFSSQADAARMNASGLNAVFSTDPPYYDNVPYADLSDYFYVWLRRSLQPIYPDLLGTVLVPKAEELVADPFRQGGKEQARVFFESGMAKVTRELREQGDSSYPTTIYYAFKQSEDDDDADVEAKDMESSRTSTGWETFLHGLVDAGWQIDGTWPLRTEGTTRMRGMSSNALASSIVLVCRPRPATARRATRTEFMNALRQELPEALRNLQHGNIAPVDMAQSAIGPGMGVFTRYAKVIESDGSAMNVRIALGIINQVLDEVLAEQEGEFDADTRWALAWFEQFGIQEGAYGEAETLSKAKNTAVKGLEDAGIVKAKSGKVKLVSRAELPDDWDPATDKRLTVWETTQHLIRILETKGEAAAAALLNKLGGLGDTARDLAYRLYSICERKKWADEALAYNSLVIAWPELSKLAHAERVSPSAAQGQLF